ncbi:glycosyltransferase family 2 protein [Proteus mirabilis]|uniref:glycosyltransferase family 2 protein n=3 Tax=Proteus mirabilis TaxID=584 RepID=UPI0023F6B3F6|nr:glycosyltransferase family 2 protein [Proteus mirabilis]MDF7266872.1 glycosyltransferase family 2 protein [Proteus mirabilis]
MITIITPAFNAEFFLEELYINLKPILNNGISWIIVNDKSTDNTFSMINSLCLRDSNIHGYHLDKNYGPHYARYFGVSKAKTKYIFLLDADDLLYSNSFNEFITFILKNNKYDFFFAPTDYLVNRKDFKKQITNYNKSHNIIEIKKPTDFILYSFPNQSNLVISKNFYLKIYKKCDLNWGEDMLFYLIISQHGIGIKWYKPISCYVISGEGRGYKLFYKDRLNLFYHLIRQSFTKKKLNSITYSLYLIFRFNLSYLYKKLKFLLAK